MRRQSQFALNKIFRFVDEKPRFSYACVLMHDRDTAGESMCKVESDCVEHSFGFWAQPVE